MKISIIPIVFLITICSFLVSNDAVAERSVTDAVYDGLFHRPRSQRPPPKYRDEYQSRNRSRYNSHDDVMMNELRKRGGMERYLPKSTLDRMNRPQTYYYEGAKEGEIKEDQYGNDRRRSTYEPYDPYEPPKAQYEPPTQYEPSTQYEPPPKPRYQPDNGGYRSGSDGCANGPRILGVCPSDNDKLYGDL